MTRRMSEVEKAQVKAAREHEREINGLPSTRSREKKAEGTWLRNPNSVREFCSIIRECLDQTEANLVLKDWGAALQASQDGIQQWAGMQEDICTECES